MKYLIGKGLILEFEIISSIFFAVTIAKTLKASEY